MMGRKLLAINSLVLVAAFLFPATGYAYLDPGNTGIIIQVLIGAAVGSMVAIKVFWGRIVNFFKRPTDKDKI